MGERVRRAPVIDVDVHHVWATIDEFLPYLDPPWRDFVVASGRPIVTPAAMNYNLPDGSNKRLDAESEDGARPGSDYETTRRQLLDGMGVDRCVLSFDLGLEAAFPNPYLAAALCRAANDWSIDRWLSRDSRLLAGLLVPTEQPDEAVREIQRLAGHPQIVEVLLVGNAIGRPFGHPLYHPIYAAAVEAGLPVSIHTGGDLIGRGRHTAGGNPESRLEQFVANDQPGMSHAVSFVTHAVFERFPTLRLLLKEHGFTWVPWLLWRLDRYHALLRRENPLVDRRPSRIFREHVMLSTQPFDHTVPREQMVALLESFGGMEDMLVFASDYPHWDNDDPRRLVGQLPEAWHERIFHDNAARLYGLPLAGNGAAGNSAAAPGGALA
jgi:uncharacterized protein